MALVLREAELNRREAALRRAEEARAEDEGSLTRASSALEDELELRVRALEQRERELEQALGAVEAQRERLEAVRAEYELRRDGLAERTREVEVERNRLRDEQAQLVCASLELEERKRVAELETPAPAVVQPARPSRPADRTARVTPAAGTAPAPGDDADWWSKQLGSPLEAA